MITIKDTQITKEIFDKIKTENNYRHQLVFERCYFLSEITLKQEHRKFWIIFQDCSFKEWVNISLCTFDFYLDFSWSIFDKYLDLGGNIFSWRSNLYLNSCIFNSECNISTNTFLSNANSFYSICNKWWS